jgi:hypothetical protein
MEVTKSKTIKWKDQSCKQRSGREHLYGATRWSTRSKSNKGGWSALEKIRASGAARTPSRSAQAGWPHLFLSPLVPVFLR